MTDTLLKKTSADGSAEAMPHDPVRDALMESRQRWQHLVSLAADMAFETDAKGCFTFVAPDIALGWSAGALIGRSSERLIGDGRTGTVLNPFSPPSALRRHRAWVRRYGGGLVMMSLSVVPLFDAEGGFAGSRGIGIDMTDADAASSQIVGRLRRGEVLDHILVRVGHESDTDSMMDAALWALVHALGAEGAAVIGSLSDDAPAVVLHECGPGALAILPTAATLLGQPTMEAERAISPDRRLVLAVGCQTRFGSTTGLVVWRKSGERAWDKEDTLLAESAVNVIRMILEYAAFARDMAHQARTDPLTGLLNRRAFLEEVKRNIARLDRQLEAGTLMFVDLDGFKAINDHLGHAKGDLVLVHFADMLKKLVRPFDSVARLGGDEFAVWLSGADHLTAAERADHLCRTTPVEMQAVVPEMPLKLGASIGIATRSAGSGESIEDLTKRADMAMYEVKRAGRNHWRVSLGNSN